MQLSRVLVAALLSAGLCAAENAIAGKWNCTNVPDTGPQSPWTLVVREESAKLTGLLTDGQVELPLVEMKAAQGRLNFVFDINGKPYRFEGRFAGTTVEGRYTGAEAAGRLQCTRSTR